MRFISQIIDLHEQFTFTGSFAHQQQETERESFTLTPKMFASYIYFDSRTCVTILSGNMHGPWYLVTNAILSIFQTINILQRHIPMAWPSNTIQFENGVWDVIK